jgi:hypothetical protein
MKEDSKTETIYVLYKLTWHGQQMWDRIALDIYARLKQEPKNADTLRGMLTIIQGSDIDDAKIATLASKMSESSYNLSIAPMWFAVWAGVDPAAAVPALSSRLAKISKASDKTQFAMLFISSLLGERGVGNNIRKAYRTVEHLKTIYLLIHEYVRVEDDIDRTKGGVYSPELRDNAQDAREALFSIIRDTPGKEAYLALMDIALLHPEATSRPWMAYHAMNKATLDADAAPWTPGQVRDFHDRLERTPSNHRDLWELAVDRLTDLKNDLEEGDGSIASLLKLVDQETEYRKFIGNWCREKAVGRYIIPQEEELADAKRPDLRFHGFGFDGPVPAEIKIADNWTGPELFERLNNQLCGDYLRDKRSSRGIFLLVYRGSKKSWDLPNGERARNLASLVEALQNHWTYLSSQFPGVEDIRVIGIDLTKRSIGAKEASK